MALSIVTYTGDGSTSQYIITFDYISRDHVAATVGGTTAAFTFINDTTIEFTTAPPTGAEVKILRQTPVTALVDFTDGSTLFEADLDLAHKQNRLLAEESRDRADNAIATLNNNIENIDAVAANEANITTVATNNDDVITVANNTANINTVSANTADISTVADIEENVTTVATNIADVNNVSANIDDVTAAVVSAATASTKATEASNSATAAAASETAAKAAQTSAETAEANAETAQANAETAETNAETSATAAANSETNAATSESNASASETNAAASALAASTSETNASASETAAALSEANASTSETNAAASETAASTSEANAATSETNASTSETNAAASASAASISETNAAASETNASASETTAATSETNAAASEGVATTQAGIATTKAAEASTSASNAASSAASAQASKDAALEALDSFDDRYLGQKAADPTLDNDGNALVAGALYFNTTDDAMKVYEGSTWVAAYASLSGALLTTNNLSDLGDGAAARLNLGLGTAATTASSAYATAAQGTLADSAIQSGDLATVATTGSYSDLTGKPTLGTAAATASTDYATTAQGTLADSAIQATDLATVATTGSYNDLSNTPAPFNPDTLATVATTGNYNDLTNKPAADITAVTAGSGLTGGGTSGAVTINHQDTSSQGSVNNSGNTVIQDITLDTYGHITGINSTTISSSPPTSYGAVGTYVWGQNNSFSMSSNTTLSGSSIRALGGITAAYGNMWQYNVTSGGLSGTWRSLGGGNDNRGGHHRVTALFVRIS